MNPDDTIYVAGHRGMVGSAIVRRLRNEGYTNILTRNRPKTEPAGKEPDHLGAHGNHDTPSPGVSDHRGAGTDHDPSSLDLRCQRDVTDFFQTTRPTHVFLAAAKVGGIAANNRYKGDFILENLQIQTNVIAAAHDVGVRKLLFLGSSCIYPKFADQPLREDSLMTGPLEPTNEPYAIAKIAGMKLCQFLREQYDDDFISMMPTNLYGQGDNYDLENSHVLPALLRKFHEANVEGKQEVEVWGSGKPRREFMHVDDCADAALFLMQNYSAPEHVNVGWGEDCSIQELAELIADVVGYKGSIRFNTDYPDGTPRKLLHTTRLTELGWTPSISLRVGIEQTYRWYTETGVAV